MPEIMFSFRGGHLRGIRGRRLSLGFLAGEDHGSRDNGEHKNERKNARNGAAEFTIVIKQNYFSSKPIFPKNLMKTEGRAEKTRHTIM